MAEQWKECRCPVRWDWPWNAFKRSSLLMGGSFERYSRQQGILVHVRMTVRKAILNEPKPFGYFWAPKVMKRIGILKLLRRFGYFWVPKVMKRIGIRELLRRFGYFWASKVTERIGIRELLRRFGYFWASKVTENQYFFP